MNSKEGRKKEKKKERLFLSGFSKISKTHPMNSIRACSRAKEGRKEGKKINFSLVSPRFRRCARWIRAKEGRKEGKKINFSLVFQRFRRWIRFELALMRRKEERKEEKLISLWFFRDFEDEFDEFDSSLLSSEGRKEERKKERLIFLWSFEAKQGRNKD